MKVRASQLERIMGVRAFGQTGETYMLELAIDTPKELNSPYIKKGNICEPIALEMLGLTKNETRYKNEYLTGTPDVVLENEIVDIKCSWDAITFFKADRNDYYWQMQAYMWLTGRIKARVEVCLIDTPLELVYIPKHGLPSEIEEAIEATKFTKFKKRNRTFDYDFDVDILPKVIERVEIARISYNQKLTFIKTFL